jgi:mRNA interferase MazF
MTKDHPKQYEIWVADLEPSLGSEPGKTRPVVILQSDLLNRAGHESFICCPVSSQKKEGISLLRLSVEPSTQNGLLKTSFILCDQVRALDGSRLKNRLGMLPDEMKDRLNDSMKIILSL